MNFDNIVLTVSSLLFEKIFHSKCHVNIRRNQLICQSAGATVPILATTKKKKKKKKKLPNLIFLNFFTLCFYSVIFCFLTKFIIIKIKRLEAAFGDVSYEKVLLKISETSKKTTSVGVSF